MLPSGSRGICMWGILMIHNYREIQYVNVKPTSLILAVYLQDWGS